MKNYRQAFLALISMLALAAKAQSQTAAPASLPPCLIQYSLQSVFAGSSRLVLYDTNLTYLELSAVGSGPLGHATSPPHRGIFAYNVDPQNANHATIVYDGGNSIPSEQLYFTSATTGGEQPPHQATSGAGYVVFTLSPRQVGNGGCNFSNLCQLPIGGSTTSGFVVQSSGPRWVLIRAVGSSLLDFGISSPVSRPSFTLYDSSQTAIGTSSVWNSDPNLIGGYETIFTLVGAFPLNAASDDGVLSLPLNPGAYTVVFGAASSGTLLCEVYILPY